MNNKLQEKNNFYALLKDAALTLVYVKEKAKIALPELEIPKDSIDGFQAIKDIVDMLCKSVNELKAEKEYILSALAAKNMLCDVALEEICKLRLK